MLTTLAQILADRTLSSVCYLILQFKQFEEA